MAYVSKRRNSPSETVEEMKGNMKAMRKGCLSIDLNRTLEGMDLQLHMVPSSMDTIKLKPSKASVPLHSRHVIHHEEYEYSCNFCPKKFPSKQALGGHQNAHKLEKVIQRRAWQGHEVNFKYTGNDSSNGMASFAFPNYFNQVPTMVSPNYPQSMQHQMYAYEHSGFVFPMSHESGVMGLGSFCTSPSPQFMSFQIWMEQGASTSKGKSIAVLENDHAEHLRRISNADNQNHENDLDLSLKL